MGFWSVLRSVIGLMSLEGNERCAPDGLYMRAALQKEVEGLFKEKFPEYEKVTECSIVHRMEKEYKGFIKAITKEGVEHAFTADIQSDWGGTFVWFEQCPDYERVVEKKETARKEGGSRKKKVIAFVIAALVVIWLIPLIGLIIAMILTTNNGGGNSTGEDNAFAEDSIVDVADECIADSLLVLEENELDFTIRTDGVGSFLLGKPFNDYSTQAAGELYANDTIDIRSSFVVQRDDSFEDISYSPYMRLDDHGITMLVLYGGFYDSRPDLSDCTVKGIHVYSPAFTTENGIHVNMTVEEVISKYSATIELQAGEGGEDIEAATLDVPACKGMKFVINLKPLISKHGGTDFLRSWDPENNCDRPNFRENLKKEIRDNCRLGRIIVGDFFDYTQEVDVSVSKNPPLPRATSPSPDDLLSAESETTNANEKIYNKADRMPSFPGGDTKMMLWLSSNIEYPASAIENGAQGRVVVSFVVEKDGSLSNVKVDKSIEASLDKEALRLVGAMPKWEAGEIGGKKVRVRHKIPITFRLQ